MVKVSTLLSLRTFSNAVFHLNADDRLRLLLFFCVCVVPTEAQSRHSAFNHLLIGSNIQQQIDAH